MGMTSGPQVTPTSETKKAVRSLYGLWRAREKLEEEYPGAIVLLMDRSSPFDLLVIDDRNGSLIAVEVKSTTPKSKASRHLSSEQKNLRKMLDGRSLWKAALHKYVLYGEPGTGSEIRRVP